MPLIPALQRQRQADFWVQGQPDLQSEFQEIEGYTEKPCLETNKQTKKKKKKKEKLNSSGICHLYCLRTLKTICLHYTPAVFSETSKLQRKILHCSSLCLQQNSGGIPLQRRSPNKGSPFTAQLCSAHPAQEYSEKGNLKCLWAWKVGREARNIDTNWSAMLFHNVF